MLVKGSRLSVRLRVQVFGAFPYRWTVENRSRATCFHRQGGMQPPAIQPVTDEQWLADNAFYVTRDGSRLMANRHHCEPAYLAEEE